MTQCDSSHLHLHLHTYRFRPHPAFKYLVYYKHVFVSHLYVIHQNCIDFLHLALKLNAQTSSSIIGNHLLLKMIELTERFCDTILKTKVKSHFDFALFAGKLSIIPTIFLE